MSKSKFSIPDPDPLEALAELAAGPRTLPLAANHPLYVDQLPEFSDAILVALAIEAEGQWDEARKSGGDVTAASGPRTKFQMAVGLRGLTELARKQLARKVSVTKEKLA